MLGNFQNLQPLSTKKTTTCTGKRIRQTSHFNARPLHMLGAFNRTTKFTTTWHDVICKARDHVQVWFRDLTLKRETVLRYKYSSKRLTWESCTTYFSHEYFNNTCLAPCVRPQSNVKKLFIRTNSAGHFTKYKLNRWKVDSNLARVFARQSIEMSACNDSIMLIQYTKYLHVFTMILFFRKISTTLLTC